MSDCRLRAGQMVRHFKGGLYIIRLLPVYMHDTKEEYVVYEACRDNKIYIRPLAMFLSEVDKKKYPNASQQYRFEALHVDTSIPT